MSQEYLRACEKRDESARLSKYCSIAFLITLITSIAIFAASPRKCPTGYTAQSCQGVNGDTYPCTSNNGTECSDTETDSDASIAGTAIIIVSFGFGFAGIIFKYQFKRLAKTAAALTSSGTPLPDKV